MLFRTRSRAQQKLFFASDIHGNERCFMKFINAAKAYEAGVLVLGGDLTGKLIVPIYRQADGAAAASFRGQDLIAHTEAELNEMLKQIRHAGCYPYITVPDEMAAIVGDAEAERALFRRMTIDSVTRWMEIATERLRGTGVELHVMLGNDDPPELLEVLRQAGVAICGEGEVQMVADTYPMISYGWATPTPWKSPREQSEEDYFQTVEALVRRLPSCERAIFNLHVPPFASELDTAPLLDENFNARYTGSGDVLTGPVGSRSVRRLIEQYQPMLGLHGHVHESRGVYRLGRTVGFNPSSDYPSGVLRGVLMVLNGKVENYTFTTG